MIFPGLNSYMLENTVFCLIEITQVNLIDFFFVSLPVC